MPEPSRMGRHGLPDRSSCAAGRQWSSSVAGNDDHVQHVGRARNRHRTDWLSYAHDHEEIRRRRARNLDEETSTSSEDTALSAVTDEYSSETGALVKLTSTIESKARTVTSVYNTLGQLTSYTDAEGSTTKYSYDVDGRVEELTEPKGKQIYAYDSTTGFLTKLLDSAAGTFTATYDVEGKMLTEGYPNGMAAKYTYNPIGQATNLEYEKTTHCTEKCVWFSDAEAFGSKANLRLRRAHCRARTTATTKPDS